MADNILSAKIQVTAPGAQAVFDGVAAGAGKTEKALFTIGQQVDKFGGGVKAFVPNLDAMKNAFGFLPPALEKANASLKKLPQASNQATQALGNLSRVAQDAPFGFLGIANNLNPLLESFQRLKATTGTTGGALKALGSSLLGAGGIGIALSVVSSLLIVFGDRLFGGGEKAKEAAKKAKEAAEALKELVRPLDEISSAAAAGASGELAKVSALSNAVLDQTNSYKERNNALNQLKEINKSYFGDLTVESAALGLLKTRVDEYTQAIINQAVVKGFADEIGKVSVELAKQEKQLRIAVGDYNKYNDVLKKTKETEKSLTGEDRLTGSFVKAKDASDKAAASLVKQNGVVTSLRQQMADLGDAIGKAVDEGLKFRPLSDGKVKKDAKDVKFEFDALKQTFIDLLAIQKLFSFQLEKDIEVRAKIKADFSTAGGRAIEGSAFTDFSKQVVVVSDKLQKEVDRLTKNNPILIKANQFTIDMSGADARIRKDLAGLNDIFKDAVTDVLGGVGEALGDAISGGDFQKGIQAVFGVVASGIQAIGKQFIKIGVLALLAKDAFKKLFANPALSIAVGIALVAAGKSLKNTLSGGIDGARALGGPVRKGGTYLVGENGPELFTPDTGGKIVSNSSLKAAGGITNSGGMAVQVVGQLLLRGNDLVAALANANRSQGRLT